MVDMIAFNNDPQLGGQSSVLTLQYGESKQEGNGMALYTCVRNKLVMLYDFDYIGINVYSAYTTHFSGLWGHNGLQMVKFDLQFEICNLNYPGVHVHFATKRPQLPERSNLT